MNDSFRYSVRELPDGKALTAIEMEKELLASLENADGKCTETLWNLAMLYQQTARFDDASNCIAQVISQVDDAESLSACYLALGQIEETRGDFHSAIRQYRRALTLEPCSGGTWYLIHNNLGYSLIQTEDYISAVPYLQHAIQIDDERPNAYKNLGLAFVGLGETHKAAAMFLNATRANATDGRSLAHLEALIAGNPAITLEMPELESQLKACREAVKLARSQQPDAVAHWQNLRKQQARR